MINFKGFIDTTLRDGQASPLLYDTRKYFFNLDEKKMIIKSLVSLGVDFIEFFSPIISEDERNDFIEIKKYISTITSKKINLLAHCRCVWEDIQMAMEIGFDGLNLYMGLSPEARQFSYQKNLNDLTIQIKKVLEEVRLKYPKVYLRYSGEDAFRTSILDLESVFDQIYNVVDTFGIPDTTGTATPQEVERRVLHFTNKYPGVDLECHFHNDRGFALINALTAIKNGAEFVDTSILGIAERSGITSLTGILLNLFEFDSTLVNKYKLELSYPINVMLASILNIHVPWTEPVSLTNRTHIAGVHQKAVLNNSTSYEAHDLGLFGVTKDQLLLGPLSGWNFIYYFLKEIENFDISKEQAVEITKEFRDVVKKKNKKKSGEKILVDIAKREKLKRIKLPKNLQKNRVENI